MNYLLCFRSSRMIQVTFAAWFHPAPRFLPFFWLHIASWLHLSIGLHWCLDTSGLQIPWVHLGSLLPRLLCCLACLMLAPPGLLFLMALPWSSITLAAPQSSTPLALLGSSFTPAPPLSSLASAPTQSSGSLVTPWSHKLFGFALALQTISVTMALWLLGSAWVSTSLGFTSVSRHSDFARTHHRGSTLASSSIASVSLLPLFFHQHT